MPDESVIPVIMARAVELHEDGVPDLDIPHMLASEFGDSPEVMAVIDHIIRNASRVRNPVEDSMIDEFGVPYENPSVQDTRRSNVGSKRNWLEDLPDVPYGRCSECTRPMVALDGWHWLPQEHRRRFRIQSAEHSDVCLECAGESVCDFCGVPAEDGCYRCGVSWCLGCRYEHKCPYEEGYGNPDLCDVDPMAVRMRERYRSDLHEPGHEDAAEYWRGQAAAYFTGAPEPGDAEGLAARMRERYRRDLHEPGHEDAAEYWRGQAAAYFTRNPDDDDNDEERAGALRSLVLRWADRFDPDEKVQYIEFAESITPYNYHLIEDGIMEVLHSQWPRDYQLRGAALRFMQDVLDRGGFPRHDARSLDLLIENPAAIQPPPAHRYGRWAPKPASRFRRVGAVDGVDVWERVGTSGPTKARYHLAQVEPPKGESAGGSYRRKRLSDAKGVLATFHVSPRGRGPRGGRTTMQHLLFDADMYTLGDVISWVHHYLGKDPLYLVRSRMPAGHRRRVVRPVKKRRGMAAAARRVG